MVQAANDFVPAKKRLGKIIVSFIDLSIHFNIQKYGLWAETS